MKVKLIVITFILCISSVLYANTPGRFGLGLILGEPTGLSLKLWQSNEIAYDAALAWAFGNEGRVHIHVDYLIHNYQIIRTANSFTPVYYGIGGRIETKDESALGVRIPLGINFRSRRIPIDVFIEMVPVLNVVPETEFDFEGGIGARYYF